MAKVRGDASRGGAARHADVLAELGRGGAGGGDGGRGSCGGGGGSDWRCANATVILNGDDSCSLEKRLPGNAHLVFPGCEGDSLLMLLDHRGIECSTGSACSAGVPEASHVLLAMGRSDEHARSSLRFSLGHTTSPADIDALAEAIGPVVERAKAAGIASGFSKQ